jgi:dTDP-4-dehydrorhamnose reductase
MNILLFGKTGQVGWELQRALAPLGNLIALMSIRRSIAVISVTLKVSQKLFAVLSLMLSLMQLRTAVDKAESEQNLLNC